MSHLLSKCILIIFRKNSWKARLIHYNLSIGKLQHYILFESNKMSDASMCQIKLTQGYMKSYMLPRAYRSQG